jgi:hypothetical protein
VSFRLSCSCFPTKFSSQIAHHAVHTCAIAEIRGPRLHIHTTVPVMDVCRYDEDAALTFGKAVSGMLAQSKGRRLGIFEEKVASACCSTCHNAAVPEWLQSLSTGFGDCFQNVGGTPFPTLMMMAIVQISPSYAMCTTGARAAGAREAAGGPS